MTGVLPRTMTASTAADIDSAEAGACFAGDRRGLTPKGRGPYQSSCSDIGGVRHYFEGVDGTIGPAATGSKQNALVSPPYDHRGNLMPAAPVYPPSSGAEVGRRFRRAHTTGSAGKR
ncbi:unnamed protein product [Ascophyllum nodosum]